MKKYNELASKCENSFLQDLGGHAFAGPIILTFFLSFLFSAPWVPENPEPEAAASSSSGADVSQAMQALSASMRGRWAEPP